jgi:hypothetical protein
VRSERSARLGENENSATRGDGELMEPMRVRRPPSRQRRRGQDSNTRIVAELVPQRGSGLLGAAVIEDDDVEVVDAALAQCGAHGGDRGVWLVPHRDQH